MKRKRAPETIPPDVLDDDAALLALIEEYLRAARAHDRLSRAIIARQRDLRGLLDENQWRAYLAVEQEINERNVRETLQLVRWAFECGRRSRRGKDVR